MLNLNNLSSTPVTLLKKTCNRGDHITILKQLIKEGKSRVFSVYENSKTAFHLNSYIELRYPEIKSVKVQSTDKLKKANLYLADFESTKKILLNNLKKTNVDFCDVLLINDIHFDAPEKSYFILLWLEIFKRSDSRPYLLMTTDCYLIPEIPFDLEKISIQDLEHSDRDISIMYHGENYSPNSMELAEAIIETTNTLNEKDKVGDFDTSLWMIFYPFKRNVSYLNKSLYQKLDKVNVYSYNNITDFSKIMQKGMRTIITIDEMYEDNMLIDPDGVIDSMVSEYRDEDGRLFYKYSSKQAAETKCSYPKEGFCYRMCTQEFFEELQKVELSSFNLENLEKMMLDISEQEIKIEDFFSPLVKKEKINKTIQNLIELGAVTVDQKVTKFGKECKNLNLKPINGCLLLKWLDDGEPIFPMIVFLVFSELNHPFIQFPSKYNEESRKDYNKRKEAIIEIFYKEKYETIFELYLKIFVMIIKTEKTINIKNYNTICKKYHLNYLAVREVFTKIKFLTDYFSDVTKIGVFNVDNLLHLSKGYLEKYYHKNLGILVDDVKGLYSFSSGDIYRLDGYKHFNEMKTYPTKIISFEKCKINDCKDSIQKSKNLIYYFVPLDTIYIEK